MDATAKLDLLRSIGADHVVDHTREDFTRAGERYDVIVDIPGNHPWREVRRALTPDGKYVLIGHDHYGEAGRRWLGSLPRFLGLVVRTPFSKQLPALSFSMPPKKDSMAVLSELIEAGKVVSVVDRTFPLDQVPDAIRYLVDGAALGKIVITM